MTQRKTVAAGNWKLNKNVAESRAYVRELKNAFWQEQGCEVIVAPTALSLEAAVQESQGSSVQIAAQNCYSQSEGAYTGEISPKYLKDLGVSHVIIGHSERRHIFGESDDMIRDKVAAALEVGLVPIFCIGETLEERGSNQVEQVLERQVSHGLKDLRFGPRDLIVAYEPVWAIGTGKVANSDDAQKAHSFVRSLVHQQFGAELGEGMRILYGGSVKPDNIADLMAQADIDGGLIGGASLQKDSFVSLVQSIGA